MRYVLMKLLMSTAVTMTLVACVMITIPGQPAFAPTSTSCQALSIPTLEPVPDVPVITDVIAKDREKTEDVLVAKIKELRDYGKRAQKTLDYLREHQQTLCH